mmetsp:Transcript_137689/g.439877  ORF Transcript_137689/g.439877 Transcript_137689/m.439877 type:complete len:341 (-) Transcript_137689:827-1849(-)
METRPATSSSTPAAARQVAMRAGSRTARPPARSLAAASQRPRRRAMSEATATSVMAPGGGPEERRRKSFSKMKPLRSWSMIRKRSHASTPATSNFARRKAFANAIGVTRSASALLRRIWPPPRGFAEVPKAPAAGGTESHSAPGTRNSRTARLAASTSSSTPDPVERPALQPTGRAATGGADSESATQRRPPSKARASLSAAASAAARRAATWTAAGTCADLAALSSASISGQTNVLSPGASEASQHSEGGTARHSNRSTCSSLGQWRSSPTPCWSPEQPARESHLSVAKVPCPMAGPLHAPSGSRPPAAPATESVAFLAVEKTFDAANAVWTASESFGM